MNPNIGIKEKTPISFFGTPMCYLVVMGFHGVNHYSMKCKLPANRKPAISRQIHSLRGCFQVAKPAGVDRWRGIFARFCQGFSNVLPRLSGLSFVTGAVNTGTRKKYTSRKFLRAKKLGDLRLTWVFCHGTSIPSGRSTPERRARKFKPADSQQCEDSLIQGLRKSS